MITAIARVLSFLLNPIFILIPVPFLLSYRQTYDVRLSLLWSAVSISILGIAGMFMVFAVWRGVFSDLDVSRRKQRPFLFLIIFHITLTYLVLLAYFNGPKILMISVFGILLSIIFISLVNRRIKASLHMATITAVLLTLGILYEVSGVTLILLPILAWSRVHVKRHSVPETIAGIAAGAFVTVMMYVSMRYILQLSI